MFYANLYARECRKENLQLSPVHFSGEKEGKPFGFSSQDSGRSSLSRKRAEELGSSRENEEGHCPNGSLDRASKGREGTPGKPRKGLSGRRTRKWDRRKVPKRLRIVKTLDRNVRGFFCVHLCTKSRQFLVVGGLEGNNYTILRTFLAGMAFAGPFFVNFLDNGACKLKNSRNHTRMSSKRTACKLIVRFWGIMSFSSFVY